MSGTCIWYFEVASPSLILELPPAGNASADFSLKDTSTAAILIVAGLLSGNLRMLISLLLSDSARQMLVAADMLHEGRGFDYDVHVVYFPGGTL